MRGLLVKDLQLVKMQKRYFLIYGLLSVVWPFVTGQISLTASFLCYLLPMFALSTVSYDEFDNGNAFLFTLPVKREEYVVGKFVLVGLLGLAAAALSVVLVVAVGTVADMEGMTEALLSIPVFLGLMLVAFSFMLPVQLKFGDERGRIARMAVLGVLFVGILGFSKIAEMLGFDLLARLNAFAEGEPWRVAFGGAAVVLSAVVISLMVSMAILKKKEF